MRVSELNIYPVKSARGIPLSASAVDAFGLTGDRVAMLVKPDGMFITQREMPALARLNVHPKGDGLVLSYDGRDGSVRAVRPENGRRQTVEVWKTPVDAAICDDAVNAALSDWLGQPVQLAVFDGASHRTASEDWAASETPVRFADGYQILVTTTASLAALNENMAANDEAPVGMDRFRPNIVIDGAEAWGEDRWAAIEIGGIRFDLVKPCSRCIMTTQDQRTGSREGANPMPAMGRLRMSGDRRVPGPLFGWNAVPRGNGRIAVGDAVRVLDGRPEGWALKRRG